MSKIQCKRYLGSFYDLLPRSTNRRLILLYHSFGRDSLSIPASMFREQIAWMMDQGTVMSADALLNDTDGSGMRIALSFDDGYASLYDQVAPILAEFGVTATVYLNTGWIGESARKASDSALGHYPGQYFLTWREVETLAKAGWTIGSHGVEHLDLTRQETAVVARELANSKHEIEVRLERPCQDFSYTWGNFSMALQHAVKAAGYRRAVSGLHGPVLASSDLYALPRVDVRAEYELRDFADVLTGRWDYLGFKQRLMRGLS